MSDTILPINASMQNENELTEIDGFNLPSVIGKMQKIVAQLAKQGLKIDFSNQYVNDDRSVYVIAWNWTGIDMDQKQKVIANITLPPCLTNSIQSPPCNSEVKAKACASLAFLKMIPEQNAKLGKMLKVDSSTAKKPPVEVLNIMLKKKKNKGKYTYNEDVVPVGDGMERRDMLRGTLIIVGDGEREAREIVQYYERYKDQSYTRNKLAAKILEAAAPFDAGCREAYHLIRKVVDSFIAGYEFPEQEGLRVELKGDREESMPMKRETVRGMLKNGSLGEHVCGFLNCVGGSIYLGVHDSRRIVQGVTFASSKEVDEMKLMMQDSLANKLEPATTHGNVSFEFHPVKYFGLANEDIVKRPDLLDDYHMYLETKIAKLESQLVKTTAHDHCYVIEIRVAPCRPATFGGRAFIRRDARTVPMSFEEFKATIIECEECRTSRPGSALA